MAGVFFAAIQPIHPPDVLSSVTTTTWAILMPLKVTMCLLFLVGITGIYAKQVKAAGWLGLVGYILLSLSWAFNLAFIFVEAFVVPLLTTAAPTFIDGFFGIINGHPVETNLGMLPTLYALTGLFYMLGGLLFGAATFRAKMLPRFAAGLLAIVSLLTPLAALLPHEIQRYAGIPAGLALAWLGYALWAEQRSKIAESMPELGSRQPAQ
ncbi:MAG: hypothetical protein GC179_13910 [Anaerolineaceae bacterium]|nr:hypothetical protein [Anaerolineaceae bacterium]